MREPAVRADAREGLRAATSLNPPMLLYTYNTRVTFTSHLLRSMAQGVGVAVGYSYWWMVVVLTTVTVQ